MRALVKARPDLTLSDLGRELAGLGIKTGLGIKVSRSSVDRFLRRAELTFKKRRTAAP